MLHIVARIGNSDELHIREAFDTTAMWSGTVEWIVTNRCERKVPDSISCSNWNPYFPLPPFGIASAIPPEYAADAGAYRSVTASPKRAQRPARWVVW